MVGTQKEIQLGVDQARKIGQCPRRTEDTVSMKEVATSTKQKGKDRQTQKETEGREVGENS